MTDHAGEISKEVVERARHEQADQVKCETCKHFADYWCSLNLQQVDPLDSCCSWEVKYTAYCRW